ncbi:VanZ family protein [Streptantibioticus rubrisoli]|uniref:VanZ family protein n=1 Tax=Streptantibioticus rubrisoli TaxID=1387313 RepID=A0ABT1PMK0_9ACTN|nr:VanZ family protein [Streptantibioticus rubrisoli]MCQ4045510.1 VanZ family protein [Streptantibioticus rubrisoli]
MQRDERRPLTLTWARPAGAVLTVVYLAVVYWLALRPSPATWMAAGNFTPLHTIRADLALGPVAAVRSIGGGLLLLAPLGVLLPLAGGRLDVPPVVSFARTVFTGLMLSLGVEAVRTWMAGQLLDVDALLLNTTGVALAHLLVVPAARRALRRRGHRRHEPRPDREPQARTPAMSGLGATR